MSIEDKIRGWLNNRREERLMEKFGGIQQCPWCRQIVQTEPGWFFKHSEDFAYDVLTCGICGGTSNWRFEMGMIYFGPRDAPKPLGGAESG